MFTSILYWVTVLYVYPLSIVVPLVENGLFYRCTNTKVCLPYLVKQSYYLIYIRLKTPFTINILSLKCNDTAYWLLGIEQLETTVLLEDMLLCHSFPELIQQTVYSDITHLQQIMIGQFQSQDVVFSIQQMYGKFSYVVFWQLYHSCEQLTRNVSVFVQYFPSRHLFYFSTCPVIKVAVC